MFDIASPLLTLVRFDGFSACFLIAAATTTPYLSGLGGCISLNVFSIYLEAELPFPLSYSPTRVDWACSTQVNRVFAFPLSMWLVNLLSTFIGCLGVFLSSVIFCSPILNNFTVHGLPTPLVLRFSSPPLHPFSIQPTKHGIY
ncbi:hypothetical protein V6N13_004613 [Hibiscus sabdariffa]